MKIKPLAARLCLIVVACLTLADVILRTIAMFFCFDKEVGYFNSSFLITLLIIFPFITTLAAVVFTLATPKSTLPTSWPEPRRNLAPVLPFALFAAGGALGIWQSTSTETTNTLLLAVGITALISSIYYFMLLLRTTGRSISNNTLSAIGYAPILWALLSVGETYTDQFTTMNSPIKFSLQLGFLGLALMTTAELRFRLNKPAPRAALCFHSIALFFCLSGSIPTLIALAAGILDRPVHALYALILLGSGIYAAGRLIFYFILPSPTAPDAANPLPDPEQNTVE